MSKNILINDADAYQLDFLPLVHVANPGLVCKSRHSHSCNAIVNLFPISNFQTSRWKARLPILTANLSISQLSQKS